jgi:hypothetical protein
MSINLLFLRFNLIVRNMFILSSVSLNLVFIIISFFRIQANFFHYLDYFIMSFLIVIFLYFWSIHHVNILHFWFLRALASKHNLWYFFSVLNILIFELCAFIFAIKLLNFTLFSIFLRYRTFAWVLDFIGDSCYLCYFRLMKLFRIQIYNTFLIISIDKIVFFLVLWTFIAFLKLFIYVVRSHLNVLSLCQSLIIFIYWLDYSFRLIEFLQGSTRYFNWWLNVTH